MAEYLTYMGDGKRIWSTREKIIDDLQAGMAEAVEVGNVPDLSSEELAMLCDIVCDRNRIVSVEPGNEIVLSNDGAQNKFTGDSGSSGCGIEISALAAAQVHERAMSMDTFEFGSYDNNYSVKPLKAVIAMQMQKMEDMQNSMIVPFFYGAMPNMGLYYEPDGPFGNPPDMMREGKVEEAQSEMEKAMDMMTRDIEFMGVKMQEAGSDGFNFDTTASAGDGDFLSVLRGVELLKKARPEAQTMVGMSSENVIGIHGMLDYKGHDVAGIYPHDQAKLAEMAGVDVFGPVTNTKSGKSLAWNMAYSVAIIKECEKKSNLPCHVNLGMGVGGIPMLETPPAEAVTRCSKAMVEVAKVDGI